MKKFLQALVPIVIALLLLALLAAVGARAECAPSPAAGILVGIECANAFTSCGALCAVATS